MNAPDISHIIDFLDRNESLPPEHEEHTYGEEEEPLLVEWNRLFPSFGSSDDDEDGDGWDFFDPDFEAELGAILNGVDDGERWMPPPPPDGPNRAHWDVCAWYQPIHFFGFDWGIFIREECMKRQALCIARSLRRHSPVPLPPPRQLAKALIRASFACYFLHEHFHHKVESFGLRAHVVTGTSVYLPYKNRVYRPNYLTDACLEEALANADSWWRVSRDPYRRVVGSVVMRATKDYLWESFLHDLPGYNMAKHYLSGAAFEQGRLLIQGQVREAVLAPARPVTDWLVATHVIRPLYDLKSNIYTVVPRGARRVIPTHVFPFTCSTSQAVKLAQKRGYFVVPGGGKGSHVKMKKPNSPTLIIPGNRKDLSPGVLAGVLKALGGYRLADLDGLLQGI